MNKGNCKQCNNPLRSLYETSAHLIDWRRKEEDFVYKEWRKDIEKMILEMNNEKKFKTERVFFREALGRTTKRLKIKANEREKMKLYGNLCWSHRGIFPETKKALSSLKKKYKIIIASNSDTKPLLRDFKKHSLKVDKILTSEMLKIYKPHKKFFAKMLEKIPFAKNEIAYVGDSLKGDVIGAHQIGVKAIWINRKNKRAAKTKPDFIVKNLFEIHKLKLN